MAFEFVGLDVEVADAKSSKSPQGARSPRRVPGSSKALSHKALSDREFEVFRLMVTGESVTDVADRLKLSAKTVSIHKARILQKMNMQSLA